MLLLSSPVDKEGICLPSLLQSPVLNKPGQEIFPLGEYAVNKALTCSQLHTV